MEALITDDELEIKFHLYRRIETEYELRKQLITRGGIILFNKNNESPQLFLSAMNGDHVMVPLNDITAVALKTEEKIRYTTKVETYCEQSTICQSSDGRKFVLSKDLFVPIFKYWIKRNEISISISLQKYKEKIFQELQKAENTKGKILRAFIKEIIDEMNLDIKWGK